MNLLQDQLYLKKGAQGAKRDRSNLRIKINEKEDIIAKTENEIAKLELQSLHLESQLNSLREKSKEIDNEMEIKKKMIDKYELEIKRQNTVIEKKQSEIDGLNKKFDELKNVNDVEYQGPLEATINNLIKEVSQKEKEYYEIQQLWIRSQTDLIKLTKKNSEMSEEIQDLKMRSTILDRKRIIINSKIESEEKEIKEHDRNINQLRHDMVKINTLISKNVDVQSKLVENNLDLENEFKAKLKESSINLLRLEEKLDTLKNEKEKALNGLVETERQMMLWEKKIQLTKETQAALDPNVGSTEIRDMKIEIHRMKLRLKGLLRLQEKMIVEMEKAVYRREYIQMKGYSKPNIMTNAQTQYNKVITELQKRIKIISSDLRECDREIQTLTNTQHQLDEQSSSIKETCEFLEKRQSNLLQEYETKYNKKNNIINAKLILQKRNKLYTEIKNGKFISNSQVLNDKKNEYKKLYEKIDKINTVVNNVEKEFGDKYNQFLIESRGLIQLLYQTVPSPKN
jgi:chromosome segregation ATPase